MSSSSNARSWRSFVISKACRVDTLPLQTRRVCHTTPGKLGGTHFGKEPDLLPGTLDMLNPESHFAGAVAWLRRVVRSSNSGGALDIRKAVVSALYRLETPGLIASEWGQSEIIAGEILYAYRPWTPAPARGNGWLEPLRIAMAAALNAVPRRHECWDAFVLSFARSRRGTILNRGWRGTASHIEQYTDDLIRSACRRRRRTAVSDGVRRPEYRQEECARRADCVSSMSLSGRAATRPTVAKVAGFTITALLTLAICLGPISPFSR